MANKATAEKTPQPPDLTSEKSLANTIPEAEKPVDVVTGQTVELPTESAVEVAPEPEKAEPVTLARWAIADEKNTRHRVDVKPGVTPEQCMNEGFWTHISMHFIPGDTIIVRPEHNEWELELHVANCGPQFAHVVKKNFYDLVPTTELQPIPSKYKVEWAGNVHKWRFLREGKMMRDGFATKALASRAATNHQMAVDR
jgi:hypothetical protein